MEKVLITGGAGFIGTHLTDKLLVMGNKVVCVDNFELGKPENIKRFRDNDDFMLYECDVADLEKFNDIVAENEIERIYHLAANSDIQKSAKFPGIDYNNTFATTYSVLEAMRRNNIKNMFFSSTSAVYGDKYGADVTEDAGDLKPISYYGGAKLASEAFISSYAFMNDMNVLTFRFPNVIGPDLTHGVIFDFINKLKRNPKELEILGDGTQCKPYLYVMDLVDAIIDLSLKGVEGVEIYNIGVDTATTVTEIADMVCERLQLKDVEYKYTGGNVGWKGDVPVFQYDLTKIHKIGWKAKHNSNEAVQETLSSLKL